jgi:hypothetical protein
MMMFLPTDAPRWRRWLGVVITVMLFVVLMVLVYATGNGPA